MIYIPMTGYSYDSKMPLLHKWDVSHVPVVDTLLF